MAAPRLVLPSIEQLISCTVCMVHYDGDELLPVVLSCGHTVCRGCAAELDGSGSGPNISCPLCREVTTQSPDELPTNYSFLALLEQVQQLEPRWCSECKIVANTTCEGEHFTCLWRREQARQLQNVKKYLKTAESSQISLEKMLSKSFEDISDVFSVLIHEVERVRKSTEDALTLMDSVMGETGRKWDDAQAAIEQARRISALSTAFDQQSIDFMRSARCCEVTVKDQHGTLWLGSFDLQNCSGSSGLVLAMISAMQRARLLKPSEDKVAKSSEGGSSAGPSNKQDVEPFEAAVLYDQLIPMHKGREIDFMNNRPGSLFLFAQLYPLEFLPDVLRILRNHGSTLERLSLRDVVEDVLEPVLAMPRLKRLELDGWLPQVADLPSFRPSSNVLRLDLLDLSGRNFGPTVVEAILRIIGGARHLVLRWSLDSSTLSLAAVIRDGCTLPESIKLLRNGDCLRQEDCRAQCAAFREALPGVDVKCGSETGRVPRINHYRFPTIPVSP